MLLVFLLHLCGTVMDPDTSVICYNANFYKGLLQKKKVILLNGLLVQRNIPKRPEALTPESQEKYSSLSNRISYLFVPKIVCTESIKQNLTSAEEGAKRFVVKSCSHALKSSPVRAAQTSCSENGPQQFYREISCDQF